MKNLYLKVKSVFTKPNQKNVSCNYANNYYGDQICSFH